MLPLKNKLNPVFFNTLHVALHSDLACGSSRQLLFRPHSIPSTPSAGSGGRLEHLPLLET